MSDEAPEWYLKAMAFPRETRRIHVEGCQIHYLRWGEEGRDYMYELMNRNAPVVEIPLAYHHMMLDRPLSLLTALRTLLADWEHSVPRKPRG